MDPSKLQGALMAIARGKVTAGPRGLAGLLVEAFHVGSGLEKALPLDDRMSFGQHGLKRLGSTRTDPGGEFLIEYDADDRRLAEGDGDAHVDLWIAVSACCDGTSAPAFVHQAPEVRYGAAPAEEFLVCLDVEYEDANNLRIPAEDDARPEAIVATYQASQKRKEARRVVASKKIEGRQKIQAEFRSKLAPVIERRLSLVERGADGKALDPHFVELDTSVRNAAETKLAEEVNKSLSSSVDRSRRMSLRGRLALTAPQLNVLQGRRIDAESDDDGFAVTEENLREVLEESGSGLNPEGDGQIVNRVDALKRFCREKTAGERCLDADENRDGVDELHRHDVDGVDVNNDGEVPVERPRSGDGENVAGGNVTLEALRGQIPTYVASVLNEKSVLDPGDDTLPAPGSRLDEARIAGADSFPSLSLPPGPADVPAFFDFHDLQIAFEPVWQEALDDSLVQDAEALYERYVEGGGSVETFFTMMLATGMSEAAAPVDVNVQRHIEIDSREWGSLTPEQQQELSEIADTIDERFTFLYQNKLQWNTFTDGLTAGDLATFSHTREYVMSRVEELRDQAGRIVGSARKELERQAAGRSIVPSNATLAQLRSRLNSAYPAKYFAANRQQRSVNFGLMLTYRQRWTPTAYQVGELIKRDCCTDR